MQCHHWSFCTNLISAFMYFLNSIWLFYVTTPVECSSSVVKYSRNKVVVVVVAVVEVSDRTIQFLVISMYINKCVLSTADGGRIMLSCFAFHRTFAKSELAVSTSNDRRLPMENSLTSDTMHGISDFTLSYFMMPDPSLYFCYFLGHLIYVYVQL